MVIPLLLALALSAPQGLPPLKQDKASVRIAAVRPEKETVRPGETFRVAFDLEIPDGWYIYPAAKTSTGTPTEFRFDAAEVAGPVGEPAPKKKKVEVVGEYDIHAGRITMSVPVKLKGDAKPGSLDVTGQVAYQICSDVCIDASTPFSFKVTVGGEAVSRPPPEVRILSVKTDKDRVQVGGVFKLTVTFEIPKDWHIYPTYPMKWKGEPVGSPTEFEIPGVEAAGKIEEPAPKRHPAKDPHPEYDYHEGTVTLTAPLRLKPGAKPGPLELKGKLVYQICEFEGECWYPDTFFPLSLTVLEGQAPTESAPVSPGAAERAAREELEKEGLWGFFLLAIGGGLLSLVMPCVYPLIPITITYFVKQGAGSRGKSLLLSSAYAAGIILAFTGIGFVFSLLLGAAGAREFASDPWVNVGVAVLFFWFAFSLFGLYEITLPSWLTGSLMGKQRSGVGGAFILGALFSVVTFTCTIPIAATILAVAASSGAEHRFIGLTAMLVYSATMALPFFLLGLFPSLLGGVKKGGGSWLHTVKVTAGFAELALALMYLAKADLVTGWGILTREVMIALWVTVLAVMALYLLRVFQLKGDEPDPDPASESGTPARRQVGVPRLLVAIVFGFLAVLMASGFNGKPLGFLDIVLPPPESRPVEAAPGAPVARHFDALPPALEEARKTGKPVFLEFTGKT